MTLLRRLILLPALLLPGVAGAATVCTVTTVPVGFGAYNPRSGTATDGVGTVNISCTAAPAAGSRISISAGRSGSFTTRRMSNGTSNLSYNLYTSSARTQIWGDGTGGSSQVSYGSAAKTYSVTVYGRIPALQNVTAGSYSDSLIVTITF